MMRAETFAAAGIVLLTNVVVLLEVAHNRSGGPVETIQLTERELPLNYRENENSGVSVRIDWRRFYTVVPEDFSQLDRAKLEALGFDYDRAMHDPQYPPLPRPAFVAFEYDGPAWARWVRSAQQAKPPLTQFEMLSRLLPVDVATTPDPLLIKYPDRQKYIIVRGVVGVYADIREKNPKLRPSISQVLPDTIHVTPPLSDAMGHLAGNRAASPRYTLTISYGRSFEPWLVTEADGK
jgi:hypothetical protein